jgi:hypothetical protein
MQYLNEHWGYKPMQTPALIYLSSFSSFSFPNLIRSTHRLIQLVGHSSTEHVIVDSDTDHSLSDSTADFGQNLLHMNASVRVNRRKKTGDVPWGSGSE